MQAPTFPAPAPTASARGSRHAGLDALKGATTLLVVLHHTAITYGAAGDWYYRELRPDGTLSSTLLLFFCTLNQAWFMGLFFLLAGYHTPAGLARAGPLGWLRRRAVRLGVPLLVYGCLLGPFTIALAHTAQGRPLWPGLWQLWQTGTLDAGPLWFAQALLAFALLAAGAWAASARLRQRLCATRIGVPWPGNRQLAAAALATGLGALALRQLWPVGTTLWGLQLGYFAGYSVLFAFGCLAWPARWLAHPQPEQVRWWRRVMRCALPMLPVVYLLGAVWPAWRGAPLSLAYAWWEPLVAWGLLLSLLQRFQHADRPAGPGWRRLSRRAFAIYCLHPPVVVGVALAWRGVAAPPLLKFALTGLLSCALCYLLAGALLRWPGVRRWL